MLRYCSMRMTAFILFLFLFSCATCLWAQEGKPANVPDVVPDATGTGVKVARAHEDFSSLTLAGSDLKVTSPLRIGYQETPTFVRELWALKWRPNDSIDLYVIRPAGVAKPPVVLYLFSWPTDTDPFKNESYVQMLVSHGVAAVGFVSALTGHRFQFRPIKQWFVSELQESLGATTHDVQLVLNYLDSRGDFDMTRVGMFGQGSGAAIAILAAKADPRIKVLDLLNPWGDWPDWLAESKVLTEKERPDYLKPDFLKKVEPLEPVRYLPDLKDRRIRIQFIDNLVPDKTAKSIEAAAPAGASVIHYATTPDFAKVASDWRLFNWVSEQVAHPTAQPTVTAGVATQVPAEDKNK